MAYSGWGIDECKKIIKFICLNRPNIYILCAGIWLSGNKEIGKNPCYICVPWIGENIQKIQAFKKDQQLGAGNGEFN
jgi:hypothetical protein